MNKSESHKDYVSRVLTPLYKNPSSGFKGRDTLFDLIKTDDPMISRRDVSYFLSNVESHQLHLVRPVNKSIRPIIAKRPHERWQIDLVDLQKLSLSNRGYKYLLNIIDVYSKFAWSIPLKDKRNITVKQAITPLLDQYHPRILQSDNGPEFFHLSSNSNIKQIFSKPHSPQTNGQIERFNATLKRKMFQLMTSRGTKIYIDALDQLVENYNNTKHSTSKLVPLEVVNGTQTYRMNHLVQNNRTYRTLNRGDKVRVALEKLDKDWRKDMFKKKLYLPRWSKKLFTIKSRSRITPHFYVLNEIGGRWEQQDLQYVDEERLVRTDQVPQFEREIRHRVSTPALEERPERERRTPGEFWRV